MNKISHTLLHIHSRLDDIQQKLKATTLRTERVALFRCRDELRAVERILSRKVGP